MNIRRRLGYWLLAPDPTDYRLMAADRQADALVSIAKSLHSIDRKMVKRRARIVECQHPELHPESES